MESDEAEDKPGLAALGASSFDHRHHPLTYDFPYLGERKPRRNWIQEERRKTLGDYTCFCLGCGAVWRYFLDGEAELPKECPHCGSETRHRCPACGAPFPSAFAVECEACGAAIRPAEVLGVRIRKPGR